MPDDFAVEPIKGLPGVLPEGEDILWQGHPNWWALSKDSLNMYWIFTYFLILALWRFASLYDLTGTGHALALALVVIAGLVACTILALIALFRRVALSILSLLSGWCCASGQHLALQ